MLCKSASRGCACLRTHALFIQSHFLVQYAEIVGDATCTTVLVSIVSPHYLTYPLAGCHDHRRRHLLHCSGLLGKAVAARSWDSVPFAPRPLLISCLVCSPHLTIRIHVLRCARVQGARISGNVSCPPGQACLSYVSLLLTASSCPCLNKRCAHTHYIAGCIAIWRCSLHKCGSMLCTTQPPFAQIVPVFPFAGSNTVINTRPQPTSEFYRRV
jgi:hypothetical protein